MRDVQQYSDYYKTIPFEEKMVEISRKSVLETINKYPHSRIVELGCGLSPLFLHFNDYQAMFIVEPALDFYSNAIKAAGGDAPDIRIKCYNGYAEDYGEILRDENIDIIVLCGLLHEVENPKALLGAVKTMCSPNTVVYINVPNAYSVHRLLAKEMGLISDIFEFSQMNKERQQHSVFSLNSLKEFVCEEGFSVLDEGTIFIKPFTHAQMQKCLDYQIFSDDLLDGLYNLAKYIPEFGAELYLNVKLK